jgi:hypothetical protein
MVMTHTVRIPWRTGDTISKWDKVCVWAIEEFGLPGNRYTTHPVADYMDFVFQDSRDAIYFKLKWL